MATKIAVLHKGRLQQVGTPNELYEEPENEFVAGFIGEPPMNFLDGELSRNGQLQVDFDSFQYELEGAVAETVRNAGASTVRMGIRPEDVELASDGEFTGRITVVEPTGSQTILYVDVGDVELIAEIPRRTDVQEDATIQFDIPQERVHFFIDGETVV